MITLIKQKSMLIYNYFNKAKILKCNYSSCLLKETGYNKQLIGRVNSDPSPPFIFGKKRIAPLIVVVCPQQKLQKKRFPVM
jgi:hypothetical protein